MAISQEWFVDYQNQVVVHASHWVYYTLSTGTFQVGETVTFDTAGTPYTGVIVSRSATFMTVVYLTASSITSGHSMTGGTSTATGTAGASGTMSTYEVPYDTLAGGNFTTGACTIGADNATIIADDTTNSILSVVYLQGSIADNDTITQGAVTASVLGQGYVVRNTTYTARQLYSFLQDTFDELGAMDDTVPMSAQTPTEFTLINGWFIDDESTKYLSGGALSSSGWASEVQVAVMGGTYTPAVPSDIGKTVVSSQGGSTNIGALLHYNNTDQKWWIRSATDITDASAITITSGTGASTSSVSCDTGETLYANVYTLGTIQITPNPVTYIFQNSAALSEWWGRGDSESHIDVLVKVKEYSTEIDGANITVFARHFGDLFDHFGIDLSSGGRNAVPLATSEDINNNVSGEITVAYETQAGGNFTVGNFVRDETTGAYGEILADSDAGTTGTLTVGNVILGTGGSGDFTNGNGISETIDGLSTGDTGVSADILASSGVTAVVRGYNDILILFQNISIPFTTGGTAEPTVGQTLSSGTGTAQYIKSTLTSGSWSGGDAVGTMYLANWNELGFLDAVSITWGGNSATASADRTISSEVGKAFEQGTTYYYNVVVDCAGRTMAQVYEWFKYVTRENANTSQTNYQTMYRVNDAETAIVEEDGEEYISARITPTSPASTSAYTPVKASPFGTLAGGKLFAARGVWVENMATADRQNFQLIDADNNTQTPPNFITITVSSVVSGDKVTVFRTSSGTTINKAQFTSTGDNAITDTTFVVSETIPSDTPNTGYIRVVDTSDTSINRESRYAYVSWSGSTFTLSGTGGTQVELDRTYSAGEDTAYVPYYDEIAGNISVYATVIYSADQTVLTRVRRYNGSGDSILPFQIAGSVTSNGYTVAAIRTADSIVT